MIQSSQVPMTKRQRQPTANTSQSKQNDERWADAIEIPLVQHSESELLLQVSGIESNTGTVFARIQRKDLDDAGNAQQYCCRVEDVVETLVQRIRNNHEIEHRNDIASSQTALALGAVWILDPASADRPQNKPTWKRLLGTEELYSNDQTTTMCWIDETMTIRLHSRPSRYPNVHTFRAAMNEPTTTYNPNGGIIYERTITDETTNQPILLFAILHKPVGLPSHATVDNGTENLLYQYQTYRNLDYASLPQRLDIETSGLVLVTTHPRCASYFSKLLEQKSIQAASTGIQKRYRCLVSLDKQETKDWIIANYVKPQAIVEHFVDANSRAPKTFVETPANPGPPHKWQLCKLRILSLSHKSPSTAELEIELLTGRTHQIRGQLAALGCPIVGDPLYGNNSQESKSMALQCCELSFHLARSVELQVLHNRKTTSPSDLEESSLLRFALDSAWWRTTQSLE